MKGSRWPWSGHLVFSLGLNNEETLTIQQLLFVEHYLPGARLWHKCLHSPNHLWCRCWDVLILTLQKLPLREDLPKMHDLQGRWLERLGCPATLLQLATRMLWGRAALTQEKIYLGEKKQQWKQDGRSHMWERLLCGRDGLLLLAPESRFRSMGRRRDLTKNETTLLMISTIWYEKGRSRGTVSLVSPCRGWQAIFWWEMVKRVKQEVMNRLEACQTASKFWDSVKMKIHVITKVYSEVSGIDIFMLVTLGIRCPFLISTSKKALTTGANI